MSVIWTIGFTSDYFICDWHATDGFRILYGKEDLSSPILPFTVRYVV